MKSIVAFVLIFSFAFSKECYFNKVNEICYYKYFDKSNIYKSKYDENYYENGNGSIYAFDKTIEVKFNSIGAIFIILNDFGLEFVDKIKNETYLFKVADRRALFPTISKLNKLKTIMKAQPHKIRKYTNSYIQRKIDAKRARFEAVMEKADKSLKNKNNTFRSKNKHIGFSIPEAETNEKKSFLKGNVR
jgi:hypothetical protein